MLEQVSYRGKKGLTESGDLLSKNKRKQVQTEKEERGEGRALSWGGGAAGVLML